MVSLQGIFRMEQTINHTATCIVPSKCSLLKVTKVLNQLHQRIDAVKSMKSKQCSMIDVFKKCLVVSIDLRGFDKLNIYIEEACFVVCHKLCSDGHIQKR